jgi:hypothetical protein
MEGRVLSPILAPGHHPSRRVGVVIAAAPPKCSDKLTSRGAHG